MGIFKNSKNGSKTGNTEQSKTIYSALDVAAYCIEKTEEIPDPRLDNYKLQKLLYYIQATFAAEKGWPCFMERIVHEDLGPIVPIVGSIYRILGNDVIPHDCYAGVPDCISDEDAARIDKVYKTFLNCSGSELSLMSHKDEPWKSTKNGDVISFRLIKDFYSKNPGRLEAPCSLSA